MPQTVPLSLVATQLALTDRRALSEAWYSALRLAGGDGRAPQASVRRGRPDAPPLPPSRLAGEPAAHAAAARAGIVPPRARVPQPERTAHLAERRVPQSELARRLQRAIARRVRRGLPASFAVRTGEGRVHVLLRSDGTCTRVVAVCAPPLRARVERALAQARFALAARGVRCEVEP
ncbi:MAG TPA: hypothetical protein VMD91_06715 [Candidatus Sulfotelmatobacter sp.]|nr:hypothetical protein [Candidatus Sulfotelmatobacter sp.]